MVSQRAAPLVGPSVHSYAHMGGAGTLMVASASTPSSASAATAGRSRDSTSRPRSPSKSAAHSRGTDTAAASAATTIAQLTADLAVARAECDRLSVVAVAGHEAARVAEGLRSQLAAALVRSAICVVEL